MKKGEIYQGTVVRMDFPNKGIVVADGMNVTVKNALPGQTVSFRITKKRNGQAEGRLLEVIENAPCEKEYMRRVEMIENAPDEREYTRRTEGHKEEDGEENMAGQGGICRYAGVCGGCLYQGFPYEEQLKIKEGQVLKLLGAYLGSLKSAAQETVKIGDEEDTAVKTGDGDTTIKIGDEYAAVESGDSNAAIKATDVLYDGILPSPKQYGYRNKMEFTFGDEWKDGPLSLGLHKRGSFYDILTVSDCLIMDEDYRKILMFTRDFFAKRNVPYFHRMNHTGYLRHLLVRKAARTGEILVALVTTAQMQTDLEAWTDGILELFGQGRDGQKDMQYTDTFQKDIRMADIYEAEDGVGIKRGKAAVRGTIRGILHIENDSPADAVKCDRQNILYGTDMISERLLGLQFSISTFSFFQTNSLGAEVLYELVREYVQGKEAGSVVYDLYSGTGTIAQMLAPAAKKVIGVEIVGDAVEAAGKNAERNGLNNCEFLAGDVLKVLDEIAEKPDYIILDPPRDGVHPKALKKIIAYGVEHMVYISCKPTSLARDLEMLTAEGYEVERLGMVDMFPGTGNVETVVLLSHKKPDSVINVKVEFGKGEGKVPLDNIAKRAAAYKPKERVTYKMIKEYIEAKYGFKVHTAYIAEVKRDLGLPMYDAPNAVEELKQPRKHPTAEKVEAIKDALRYFGVIYEE